MTQRDELIKELIEKYIPESVKGKNMVADCIADFIIADRKRIVEPLKTTKELISQSINSHNKQCVLSFNAIDETLRLAGEL
jgi:hypothetical protein